MNKRKSDTRKVNPPVSDLNSDVATPKNATPTRIAFVWRLAQKPWIVPIPGATKLHRLEENVGVVSVELTPDDLRDIATAVAKITVQGGSLSGKAGEDDRSLMRQRTREAHDNSEAV